MFEMFLRNVTLRWMCLLWLFIWEIFMLGNRGVTETASTSNTISKEISYRNVFKSS